MSEKGLCKGCAESVIVTEEVIQEILSEAEAEGSKIVSDQIYEERLSICNSCLSLQYGTTCKHSGCIVRYRAKFQKNRCPFPGDPKWEMVRA